METQYTEYRRCVTVADAVCALSKLVERQNGGDANYFKSERNRFVHATGRIIRLCPPPRRVLDIGSHYLHQAALLSLLGYDVCGLDVPLFTDVKFIRERSDVMKIRNIAS